MFIDRRALCVKVFDVYFDRDMPRQANAHLTLRRRTEGEQRNHGRSQKGV